MANIIYNNNLDEQQKFSTDDLDLAPWLFRVPLYPGESLTSLLCRQRRECQMSWSELFKKFGCIEARYTSLPELDIAPPEQLILGVSIALDIPIEKLMYVSLDRTLELILPPQERNSNLGHNWRSRHITWVLPNAWQAGRSPAGKSRGGIPYCPLCFAESEDPFFPLRHRISILLTCYKHGIWLRDDCPRCGSPVGPMSIVSNGDWSLGRETPLCNQCPPLDLERLNRSSSTLQIERAGNHELEFHALLSEAFDGRPVSLRGIGELPAVQFLSGLRYINTAASHFTDQGIHAPTTGVLNHFPESGIIPRSKGQRSLELVSLNIRRQRIGWFQWICERPLDRWHIMRNLLPTRVALKKSWIHPWEGVEANGEFQTGNSWQSGRKTRTERANLGQVKLFFELANKIKLSEQSICGLLGEISSRECQVWSNIPSRRMPMECRHRMAHFLRIWNGLLRVFRDEGAAIRWFQEANGIPRLNGMSPIQYLSRDRTGQGFEFVSELIGVEKNEE